MQTYIALLRGINVGGHKKILMSDLKVLLESIGLNDVRTYIQSGNVIFRSKEIDLENQIEKTIQSKYGFEVPTFVITPEEMELAFKNNPFHIDVDVEGNLVYAAFLSDYPNEDLHRAFVNTDFGEEKLVLVGKVLYFFVPKGYHNAKLNNNLIETKLKVKATTRNFKTIRKLLDLVGEK